MFGRKRTDRNIVRIHKKQIRKYLWDALEERKGGAAETAATVEAEPAKFQEAEAVEEREFTFGLKAAESENETFNENCEAVVLEEAPGPEISRKECMEEIAKQRTVKGYDAADDIVFSLGDIDDRVAGFGSFAEQKKKEADNTGRVRFSLKRDSTATILSMWDKAALDEYFAKENRKHLRSVDDCINMPMLEFGEVVKSICEVKEMKPADVYKTALLDRRLYSKITKDISYYPGRDTCIALAFGLRLSFEEVGPFLKKAGYALSDSIRRDIVFEYCFKNRLHDVRDVNEILDELGEKIL